MDLKVTIEAWGGFKVFDFICLYCLVFLLKEFITINLNVNNNLYFLLFLLLGIVTLIGGLASEFPDKTYLNVVKTCTIFIFGRFLLTEIYKDPTFHYRAIKALKVAYFVSLAFLLLQVVVGLKLTFYPSLAPNTVDPVFKTIRYPGVFYDSQASGQFLAMGSFLFLYFEKNAPRKTAVLNYLVFAIAVAGVILAGSRAALGGLVLGLVVVIMLGSAQYRLYGSIVIGAGLIAYLVFTPSSGIFERAGSISEDYSFRASIWKEALQIAKKHPYLGIGSNNYQNYIMRHVQDQYLEVENNELVYFTQPENGYLKIMVELGYTGFAIFVLFLAIPILKGFINFFTGVYDRRVLLLIAALISWMVAFYTVYTISEFRLLIMITSMLILIISFPRNDYDANSAA
ncbi:O-antigen ligase family protein [Mucilaginibacter sp. PAMB04168]|uniref:O-antigen ligase family protein n=1 Tax=Mucilaginibacter sp. PAMB04168 TaxID=3138567 RepID=UPI0031F6AA8A